jgi:hypothetical protein
VKEFIATYKCKLCGKSFEAGRTGSGPAQSILIAFEIGDPSLLKNIMGASYMHPTCTHFCSDESFGLAEFLGFKIEDNEEDLDDESEA